MVSLVERAAGQIGRVIRIETRARHEEDRMEFERFQAMLPVLERNRDELPGKNFDTQRQLLEDDIDLVREALSAGIPGRTEVVLFDSLRRGIDHQVFPKPWSEREPRPFTPLFAIRPEDLKTAARKEIELRKRHKLAILGAGVYREIASEEDDIEAEDEAKRLERQASSILAELDREDRRTEVVVLGRTILSF